MSRALIVGGGNLGIAAAMLALAGSGLSVVRLEDDPYDSNPFPRRERSKAPSERPKTSRPVIRSHVEHIDTPKPMTKRKARRLRGKARP